MRSKKIVLTNFSRSQFCESNCLRPDNERQLTRYLSDNNSVKILARGAGLSYSDSNLLEDGVVIDTSKLNHLISFDVTTGIVVCQGAVLISNLLLMNPDFIPPVMPGTLHATVAGAIAHDIHGKNNHLQGSFGHHLVWFDLHINNQVYRCSHHENTDLFKATIGGLGLTGIITRVALRLKKASRHVTVENHSFQEITPLINSMSTHGLNSDYQVAWIDLLHAQPRSILTLANHSTHLSDNKTRAYTIPRLPFSLIKRWNMTLFNTLYFNSKQSTQTLTMEAFNNPLDKIGHWNRLYGPKGLIQFQALFPQEQAADTMAHLLRIIKNYQATPTLAVLKLFIQSGEGLLSFCKPGFTLAIDFINDAHAHKAILAMNQLITELNGNIYLAKDRLLTAEQFQMLYPSHQQMADILADYHSPMQSELAKRLRITT